jgi:glutaconate CoA-transferase subunit B
MLEAVQIDRFGQVNTCAASAGGRPSREMSPAARGFAGNAISQPGSFFVPAHNPRTFPAGECDYVSSIGFNPARLPRGRSLDDIDIRRVITDLCVMDFGGPGHQLRLLTLHPGITAQQVRENTGFPISIPDTVPTTPAPTVEQLAIIAALDPHNQRAAQIVDNPPGDRA